METSSIRFVIFGLPRSGTHFLRGLLNQHSQIRCTGELFNPHYTVPKYDLSYMLAMLRGPIAGCILHATNGDDTNPDIKIRRWYFIWERLPEHLTHVIVLRRKNHLARYVSDLVAYKRKGWQFDAGATPPPVAPFQVDPDHAARTIAASKRLLEQRYIALAKLPYHTLYYEDLCAALQPSLADLHRFLGVDPQPAQPTTAKVGIPLSEQVSNYSQVEHLQADC